MNPSRRLPSSQSSPHMSRSAILIVFLGMISGFTAAQTATEDELEAAYIYNFAISAQWPAGAMPTADSRFVIGVSGMEGDVLSKLRSVTNGRTVGSHPIQVILATSVAEMRACQVLFFHTAGKERQRSAISGLQGAPVLLVGEDPAFLRDGGMINLFVQNGRMRFEVSRQALDQAGIQLSPALLQFTKSEELGARSSSGGHRELRVNPPPEFPELARRMDLSGAVRVEALVRRDGSVKGVRVLGGNPVLAEALSAAVMAWKYEPGPQETVEQVEYAFK